MKYVKGRDYDNWRVMIAGLGMPDDWELNKAKLRRTALPEEINEKRFKHMKGLHDGGAPYSWIAKLYRLNRSQVYRIINKINNNL